LQQPLGALDYRPVADRGETRQLLQDVLSRQNLVHHSLLLDTCQSLIEPL